MEIHNISFTWGRHLDLAHLLTETISFIFSEISVVLCCITFWRITLFCCFFSPSRSLLLNQPYFFLCIYKRIRKDRKQNDRFSHSFNYFCSNRNIIRITTARTTTRWIVMSQKYLVPLHPSLLLMTHVLPPPSCLINSPFYCLMDLIHWLVHYC